MNIGCNKKQNSYTVLRETLRIDCKQCSGLCCIALYCAKAEGFPKDKAGGVPCVNLAEDFGCGIHSALAQKGMRGCLGYDCFGAGQQVTRSIYKGRTWRDAPTEAQEIFRVFLVVYQLHQMLWYLLDAAELPGACRLMNSIGEAIEENCRATAGKPDAVLAFDLEEYRARVNHILKQAVGSEFGRRPDQSIGKNFRKGNFDGRDFSMSLLIAANLSGCSLRRAKFLGADLRDANLCGADLRCSVFLTQGQVNAARGDGSTQLPASLLRPGHWPG